MDNPFSRHWFYSTPHIQEKRRDVTNVLPWPHSASMIAPLLATNKRSLNRNPAEDFLEGHVHWYNLKSDGMEFRLINRPWNPGPTTGWTLQRTHNSAWRLSIQAATCKSYFDVARLVKDSIGTIILVTTDKRQARTRANLQIISGPGKPTEVTQGLKEHKRRRKSKVLPPRACSAKEVASLVTAHLRPPGSAYATAKGSAATSRPLTSGGRRLGDLPRSDAASRKVLRARRKSKGSKHKPIFGRWHGHRLSKTSQGPPALSIRTESGLMGRSAETPTLARLQDELVWLMP